MAEYPFADWKGGSQTFGNRRMILTQHTGPSSYTQITAGTPPAAPTGGDSIDPAALGMSFIEAIIVLGDSSGTYTGVAFQPAVSTSGQLTGAGASVPKGTKIPLMWLNAHTGAEVTGNTNLSAAQLNLVVIGQ